MNTYPITQLDNDALEAMLTSDETGSFQVVDVRTPEEHHYLGHIPSAILLPLHELPHRHLSLDKTKKTVLVCEHGVRSMDASAYLCHLGFAQVYNLTYGMAVWSGSRVFPRYPETVEP